MDPDSYRSWLSAIAVMLTVTAFFPYILSMLRGRTRPHVLSWAIWSMNTSVAFLAAHQAGGGIGNWVIGFSAGVTLFIAVLACVNRSDVTVTSTDRVFFTVALAAMPMWLWLDDPLWAIWLVTIIELLGFAPTLRKAWGQPYSEPMTFLGLLIVRNGLVIAALEHHSTTTVLFPAAMAGACLALIAIMAWRRPRVTTQSRRIRL